MIDDINDARKIFVHICFYIIWSFEKFRNAVIQVGCDHSASAFLIIFIKFIQTVCEQTVGSIQILFALRSLTVYNIQHTSAGEIMSSITTTSLPSTNLENSCATIGFFPLTIVE